MDFGKKVMEKLGWKEGDGLGKNRKGIKKAIKANLKFDTSGLGHDKAADFNNHWWQRVFNEAANNINVKSEGNEILMAVKNKNAVEISTKEYSMKKLAESNEAKNQYGNFLKTSTLSNTGNEELNPQRIEIDDIKVAQFKQLTDEELFAACGGRTAHKGARHGLQLSGKLSRVEEQEKQLLEKMSSDDWTTVKSRKKSKRKLDNNNEDPMSAITFTSEYCISSKKQKKKQKKLEKDLADCTQFISIGKSDENIIGISNKSKKIKKSKNKQKFEINELSPKWNNYRNTSSNVIEDDDDDDRIVTDEEISQKDNISIVEEKCEKNKKSKLSKKKIEKIKKKELLKNKKNAKKLRTNLVYLNENLDNIQCK